MIIKSYTFFVITLVINNLTIAQVMQEWIARYSGTTNSSDGATEIVIDNSNNIYVSGASIGLGTNYDFATIKYSSLGNQDWIMRYNGPGNGPDIPNAMTMDSEGNVYVTGGSQFNVGRTDFVTIKYSSDGVLQWIARYPGSGDENFPTSIICDKSNNIYVTGKIYGIHATIKYNSNGIQQWIAEFPAPVYEDIPWAIVVDDSSNVYIAGENSSDCITIKYDSNGVQKWVETYNGKANQQDFANSIGVDKLGNIYIGGSSVEYPNLHGGYLVIKYNTLGILQWVRIYEGSSGFFDVPRAMKVDSFGNVYITGYSTETGQGYNYTTIKYNTNGDTLWKSSYHKGPNDIAFAMTLDNDGNVYVTGESDGNGTGDDYATVKYNSLGQQQWVKRYDYSGQFGDASQAIDVDNHGNVYVTGSSNRDFLTIKYSQPTNVTQISSQISSQFKLEQNYPNPFNPKTIINYQLSMFNYVSLKVFDALGNEVAELVNGKKNAGIYEVEFDGSNYSSGVYFYKMIVDGNIIDTKRMLLLK